MKTRSYQDREARFLEDMHHQIQGDLVQLKAIPSGSQNNSALLSYFMNQYGSLERLIAQTLREKKS